MYVQIGEDILVEVVRVRHGWVTVDGSEFGDDDGEAAVGLKLGRESSRLSDSGEGYAPGI